ncbi:MAG: hypothetical protein Rhirs2KO_10860 [Rhizobiaceae bacterium]
MQDALATVSRRTGLPSAKRPVEPTCGPASVQHLTAHAFKGHTIRVVEIDGNPWFVGSDVLTTLLGTSNGKGKIYQQLEADELRLVNRIILGDRPGKPMRLVSESGLYKLIMRSDKPEAVQFQDWVTREVLPANELGAHTGNRQRMLKSVP